MDGGENIHPLKSDLSEEERRKLSEKLDRELEEFISGLEKKGYNEGWSENNWQEEMEKHPFFMTKQPEEGEDLSPLMEGIRQLKYDSSENSPEELAATYKEDGNFNFKCKNYRMAIISYTEGLRQKCKDVELNAQLYNNRAAAQYFLTNYRSCYNDCKAALKLWPVYQKAELRLAQVTCELGLYEDCVTTCESLLNKIKSSSDRNNILALKEKAVAAKVLSQKVERKAEIENKMTEMRKEKVLAAINNRGIHFLGGINEINLTKTLFPDVFKQGVHLVGSSLVWPVILMYPEYKVSDFIQEFHEDSTFQDQLQEILKDRPSWDEEGKYTPKKATVYYEDIQGTLKCVNKQSTLGSILSCPGYRVDRGTPVFIILAKDSRAEKQFLQK